MELVDLVAYGDRAYLPEAGKPSKGRQAHQNKQEQNLMIHVYTIKSVTKKFRYVGITNNLGKRLLQHNKGYNTSTKKFLPFKLVLKEEYNDYKEARKREKFLKSGFGRKFLDSLETS